MPNYQFEIFWEADAPERPDPYLANLDLAAIGAKLEGAWSHDESAQAPARREMMKSSPFSVRGRRALAVMRDERELSVLRRQLGRLGMTIAECDPDETRAPTEAFDVIIVDADILPAIRTWSG